MRKHIIPAVSWLWILSISFCAPLPTHSAPMGTAFTYQGRLNQSGAQANGSFDFQFKLYDALTSGAQVGPIVTKTGVMTANGLFTAGLDFGSVMDGRALWLEVAVKQAGGASYTTLTPRQALTPAPNALFSGKTPWSGIIGLPAGFADGVDNNATYAPGSGLTLTGNTFSVQFSGSGSSSTVARSDHNHFGQAITGSNNSSGFDVQNLGVGSGISAVIGSNDPLMAALSGESKGGAAGVMAISKNGYAMSAIGVNSYALWAAGVESATGFSGDIQLAGNYGEVFASGPMYFYTNQDFNVKLDDDNNSSNKFSIYNGSNVEVFRVDEAGNMLAAGSKAGYVVDVMQSEDVAALTSGDVVMICGSGPAIIGEIPVIKVRRATSAQAEAVVGVVDQHYMPAQRPMAGKTFTKQDMQENKASYDTQAVNTGEYLSVVTLGAFKSIKVDAKYGAILPGNLLTASPNPGYAMKASAPRPGAIIGKALGSLSSGTGTIPILVTLH